MLFIVYFNKIFPFLKLLTVFGVIFAETTIYNMKEDKFVNGMSSCASMTIKLGKVISWSSFPELDSVCNLLFFIEAVRKIQFFPHSCCLPTSLRVHFILLAPGNCQEGNQFDPGKTGLQECYTQPNSDHKHQCFFDFSTQILGNIRDPQPCCDHELLE